MGTEKSTSNRFVIKTMSCISEDSDLKDAILSGDPDDDAAILTGAAVRYAMSLGMSSNRDMDDVMMVAASYDGEDSRVMMLRHLTKSGVFGEDMTPSKMMLPGSVTGPRNVISAIAKIDGLTPDDITFGRRDTQIISSAFRAQWVCRRIFGMPLTSIADHFGKSHPAIVNGINRTEVTVQRSPILISGLVRAATDADNEVVRRFSETIRVAYGEKK